MVGVGIKRADRARVNSRALGENFSFRLWKDVFLLGVCKILSEEFDGDKIFSLELEGLEFGVSTILVGVSDCSSGGALQDRNLLLLRKDSKSEPLKALRLFRA